MAAEQVAEQVAEHLEEAAEVTRQVDARVVGFFFSGIAVGGVVGFILGYRFNRERIKAEAFKQSEEEVQRIRELYQAKMVAAEPKPSVDEVIAERGYSRKVKNEETEQQPRITTTAEGGYVNYGTGANQLEVERPLRPPVPIRPEPQTERVFRTTLSEKDKNDNWSYPYEMTQRTPNAPYIIHQDEYVANESGYNQVTYVYYAGDDILTDEDDAVISNRENVIGTNMVTKFGHGTDDYNILYIRNPVLELEFELCRSPGSYAEEVLGLDPNEPHDEEE